jgi:hypothetical protein
MTRREPRAAESKAPGAFVQSAENLRLSLEEAADALATADLARLLTCEARIHAALTHIVTSDLSEEDRARLAHEIERTRKALTRCRRFGVALSDFVRIGLTAHGLDEGYGRSGASMAAGLHTIHRTA